MGNLIFRLPPDLSADERSDLEFASVLGGQDNMPYATQVLVEDDRLILHRAIDESGAVLLPWAVDGAGHVMVATASLMERLQPYDLAVELARGKVNQLRGQTADWQLGGLLLPDNLAEKIRRATHTFRRTLFDTSAPGGRVLADQALADCFRAGNQLVRTYIQQVFQVRHHRQPRLETLWGCRATPGEPAPAHHAEFLEAFNSLFLPFSWQRIEPEPGRRDWRLYDELLHWAGKQGLHVVGGPLIDFSGRGLPDWLWPLTDDLNAVHRHLSEFVDAAVRRYGSTIRQWHVTAASNWAGVLARGDEQLLWLTLRLVEVLRKIDPGLEPIVGLAQPMGDYLAHQEHNQSPFGFADTLVRTGIKLAGLEIELIMGAQPRGSYCRDMLDLSRFLDLYALLGLPLHVTLGYPAAEAADPLADGDLRIGGGRFHNGFTAAVQEEWAGDFAQLCLCKPYIRALAWTHWDDRQPHLVPHGGLVDAAGNLRPALRKLVELRWEHLK